MASHDYYSSFDPRHQDTSYQGRSDNPLPPIPASPSFRPTKPTINTGNTSPVISPFEDHAYPAYPQPSLPNVSQQHLTEPESPHYYGRPGDTGSTYSQNDPFTDGNAIPLQSKNPYDTSKMGGVGVTTSPTEAEMGYNSRPDRDPRRPSGRGRQKRKKNGLFTGKITWAVYTLTLVQLIVFIYEITHNGKRFLA
jgi:hypothetical protein